MQFISYITYKEQSIVTYVPCYAVIMQLSFITAADNPLFNTSSVCKKSSLLKWIRST